MDLITAQNRAATAKAKQLRRLGIVPCVIYGAELEESLSIQIDQATARQLRRTKRSGSQVAVQVDGKTYHTLIRELECNQLTGEIVHISFQVLDAGKKVTSVADIFLINKDKVAGILEQLQMQVPHAAQPEDLLDAVTVDLENLPVGTALTIGDIPEFCSDKIELLTDAGNLVLRIRDKKRMNTEAAE